MNTIQVSMLAFFSIPSSHSNILLLRFLIFLFFEYIPISSMFLAVCGRLCALLLLDQEEPELQDSGEAQPQAAWQESGEKWFLD